MIKYVIGLACLVCCVTAVSFTPIKQCDSKLPLPIDVKINDCQKLPCELKRGSNVTSTTTFGIPFEIVEDMNVKVKATSLGTVTNYPLPDPGVCEHLIDTGCPVTEGEEPTYSLVFPIFGFLEPVPVTIELTIESDQGGVTCFVVDCQVV